ncbi:MAG: prepilin-type N-terminal cleavage/methylation domain-containing protein [Candidatus Omnitrophota bacterium]
MHKKTKISFTLIEVVVAIAVFTVIITSFSGIFMAVYNGWFSQTTDANLVDDLRWAFTYMSQEIRQAGTFTLVNQNTISFRLDTNNDGNPDTTVWYWRGNSSSDTIGLGDRAVLYRGVGADINAAYAQRQPLTRFLVDNPAGKNIFTFSANILEMELTASSRNRFYSLRTIVRIRNA